MKNYLQLNKINKIAIVILFSYINYILNTFKYILNVFNNKINFENFMI